MESGNLFKFQQVDVKVSKGPKPQVPSGFAAYWPTVKGLKR
jgi:hypothetical protein